LVQPIKLSEALRGEAAITGIGVEQASRQWSVDFFEEFEEYQADPITMRE
jgi:hypothetical protein